MIQKKDIRGREIIEEYSKSTLQIQHEDGLNEKKSQKKSRE